MIKGKLEVNHMPAAYQRVDILTKSHSTKNFTRLRTDLKVESGGGRKENEATLPNFEGGNNDIRLHR